MNVHQLQNCINTIGNCGLILSTEEACILESSLLILQRDNHFRNVFLWGKILGTNKDYYIAFGYVKDILNCNIFFYSTDGTTWMLLPRPNHKSLTLTPLCVTRFQGDPTLIVDVFEQYANAQPYGTAVFNRRQRNLKEEDRLAAVVELINNEALVTPRGALFKRPDGLVVENLTYEGLTHAEAKTLQSYMHWRLPRQRWNTNLLTRNDYNYALDFLDTLDKDVPHTSWALQICEGGWMAILRSLHYPGAVAFQRVCKPDHGWIYIGYGKHNLDVPHMLHKWD